jgi:membrane protease YdiL (CAAX protease family)
MPLSGRIRRTKTKNKRDSKTCIKGNLKEVYEMTSRSRLIVWRNICILTLMFCLLYGLPNLVILASYLPKRMDLHSAAVWTAVGLGLSGLILLIAIMIWLRRTKQSLKDLGWGKPTSASALVLGVLFAFALLGLCYTNNKRFGVELPIGRINPPRILAAVLTAFAGIVEEIGMRGVLMTELDKIKTRTWLQVLISGFCYAIYHSLQFLASPVQFVQSMTVSTLLGIILAGIYVLGRRSLTPCILSHGLANLLGEPYILMGALAAFAKFG